MVTQERKFYDQPPTSHQSLRRLNANTGHLSMMILSAVFEADRAMDVDDLRTQLIDEGLVPEQTGLNHTLFRLTKLQLLEREGSQVTTTHKAQDYMSSFADPNKLKAATKQVKATRKFSPFHYGLLSQFPPGNQTWLLERKEVDEGISSKTGVPTAEVGKAMEYFEGKGMVAQIQAPKADSYREFVRFSMTEAGRKELVTTQEVFYHATSLADKTLLAKRTVLDMHAELKHMHGILGHGKHAVPRLNVRKLWSLDLPELEVIIGEYGEEMGNLAEVIDMRNSAHQRYLDRKERRRFS